MFTGLRASIFELLPYTLNVFVQAIIGALRNSTVCVVHLDEGSVAQMSLIDPSNYPCERSGLISREAESKLKAYFRECSDPAAGRFVDESDCGQAKSRTVNAHRWWKCFVVCRRRGGRAVGDEASMVSATARACARK